MFQAIAKPPPVSVIIPARNEAATVARIVELLVDMTPVLHEVVVVDDGSTDDTAAVALRAGARVVDSAAPPSGRVRPGVAGAGPGKGRAMWVGLAETTGEIVVFCDADVSSFHDGYVTGLVAALDAHPGAVLAKGSYRRGGTGGRVNALVARPALDLLHPHLGHISQPLGGEYAAWRGALEQVPFVCGYGVDVGLLIDLTGCFGADAVVEADLGWRHHRNRSLDQLRPQAQEVLEVILHRAGQLAPRPQECPPLCSQTQLWVGSASVGGGEAS